MNAIRLSMMTATLFCAMHAAADTPRSVDAEQFDIAGIKLGMGRNDAVAAITEKLHLNKRAIQFEQAPQLSPVTNTKEPKYFTAKSGVASVTVHFEPKIPQDKAKPMVVSMVIYEQPWTPENVDAMKQAALDKYGSPSNGLIGVSYQWCLHPHSNPGFGCADFQGPILKLGATKLELSDVRYQQARMNFMNKMQSGKPAF